MLTWWYDRAPHMHDRVPVGRNLARSVRTTLRTVQGSGFLQFLTPELSKALILTPKSPKNCTLRLR